MNILAIESSCDETACAILQADDFGEKLLSNVVVSQIDIFKEYGGVIPEVAARSHLEAILPVIDKAFRDADLLKDGQNDWDSIDYIAATHTPGLLGSLLIGTLTARTLAILHNKPLYAVHHLKSHIYSNWIPTSASGPEVRLEGGTEPRRVLARDTRDGGLARRAPRDDLRAQASITSFPLLALVVSGGHTQIIYMKSENSFEIVGTTLDDAIGECFDKVAKILGLPYPGGPSISEAAKSGDPEKYKLPHPKIDGLDFSFSGLKTAVLRAVQKEVGVPISYPSHELKSLLTEQQIADFAASFEKTAVDILLEKLSLALEKYHDVNNLVFAGGVSANQKLREEAVSFAGRLGRFENMKAWPEWPALAKPGAERVSKRTIDLSKREMNIFFPELHFSGDNAAMVAKACLHEIRAGIPPTDPYKLDISPRSVIK